MQPPSKPIATAAGLLALGVLGGWSVPALMRTGSAAEPSAASAAGIPIDAAPSVLPAGAAPNYRAIFQENKAAVVGITTAGMRHVADEQPFDFGDLFGRGQGGGSDDENPLSQFFHGLQGPRGGENVPTRALGSGFIVSSDGLVLTNAHVVAGAQQVTVTLADHREYKAKVLGADRSSDIAVLKIDARALPTVRLGNSDQLSVGDYVMAIGAPFGLSETATAGIVSATGRSLPGDGYVPFIQTDAAVNPGNSGGPLFNSNGAVVGINSQIYSNSGGYQGISFAIPINVAMQIEHQVVTNGKVSHGQLGVEVQNVTQSLAHSFKLSAPEGALVAQVQPDSAAARAGLKAGDVILKYDGAAIDDAGQLSAHVSMSAPGERAALEVWRDGKTQNMSVTVGSATHVASDVSHATDSGSAHLGLSVRPMTHEELSSAGLTHGLVVEDSQGPAAQAGIQQGDVLLAVDGTPIQSVDQLKDLVRQHDKQLALLIQRGDQRLFVPLELG